MKSTLIALAIAASGMLAGPMMAYATSHAETKISDVASFTEGEIRKVDKDAKKLTIRHGPLENLKMPAMTMVFQVKDQSMLDRVKAGDKVRFSADKVGGAYTVTHLETSK